MANIAALIDYAKSFRGVPYKFGGKNRLEGIDCSQLIVELLISRGLFPHSFDTTAQGLFDHFIDDPKANLFIGSSAPMAGSLAFYGINADHIVHVAFCIDEQTMIEAGGGTSSTDTLQEAIDKSAMVRERPIKYRKDFFCCVMPNYDKKTP